MKPIHHLNNHQDDPELSDHHPSLPSCLASEHNRTRPPCYHNALTLSITHTCWLSLGPTTSSPVRTAASQPPCLRACLSLPSTALRNQLYFFSSLPSSSFFLLQHILYVLPYAPAVTRASCYLWMGLAPGIGGLKSDQSTTSWCLMRVVFVYSWFFSIRVTPWSNVNSGQHFLLSSFHDHINTGTRKYAK